MVRANNSFATLARYNVKRVNMLPSLHVSNSQKLPKGDRNKHFHDKLKKTLRLIFYEKKTIIQILKNVQMI